MSKRLEGQAIKGHHGVIREALPAILMLLERMENGISETQSSPRFNFLIMAYKNAWEKLRKYSELTHFSHGIYGSAVLLHLSYRKHYFGYH